MWWLAFSSAVIAGVQALVTSISPDSAERHPNVTLISVVAIWRAATFLLLSSEHAILLLLLAKCFWRPRL